MSIVIRLYNIVSKNPYNIFYKKGDTPYPISSGFTQYGEEYTGTTLELHDINLISDSQYWIKLVDTITGKYIIENIYTNDSIAYADCGDICELDGEARFIGCEMIGTAIYQV